MTRLDRLVAWFRQRAGRLPQGDGLGLRWQCAVFVAALACLFSRWPQLFLHAQFYAEDGKLWYADAYQGGWLHSLTLPYAGYLNTLQRLGTGPAMLVPFRDAPTMDALVGLLLQVLPIPFLLSSRCRDWAPLPARLAFAVLYVALPNAAEIFVNLGNSQWHLALLAVLLAFTVAPHSRGARLGESLLFAVAGFCGPFCILLLPLVLLFWWVRRQGWTLVVAAAMAAGSAVQLYLVTHAQGAGRVQTPLGASIGPLLRIVGGQIALNAMLGAHDFTGRLPMPAILVGVAVGVTLYWTVARKATLPLKLLLAYSFLLLAASLRTPQIAGNQPLWSHLAESRNNRYWFFPTLSFLWSAAWCVLYSRSKPVSRLAACVLCLSVVGMAHDWRYRPFQDEDFATYAARFEASRPGEQVVIPITPTGWTMELVKK